MSFSSSELSEFFFEWEELNLTDHDNISQVETQICPTFFSHSALLQTMCTFYIFIFLLGLTTNILVVWVSLRSERRHHQKLNFYIFNLAVADLSVVATLPIWVSSLAQGGHWPFGQAACKLTHFIFSVNLFASIFFLACMSMDRYLTVVYLGQTTCKWEQPLRYLVCAGTWLTALIASVPDTYFLQSIKSLHGNVTLCRPVYPEDDEIGWMVGVQLSFVVLGFAVPFPVIVISYALLAYALTSSSSSSTNTHQELSVSKKGILTYFMVFLACWAPYHVVLLVDALVMLGLLPLSCGGVNGLFVALNLTQCLSLLHCCLNPVVYSFVYCHRNDFKKAFIFNFSTHMDMEHLLEDSQGTETEPMDAENQL